MSIWYFDGANYIFRFFVPRVFNSYEIHSSRTRLLHHLLRSARLEDQHWRTLLKPPSKPGHNQGDRCRNQATNDQPGFPVRDFNSHWFRSNLENGGISFRIPRRLASCPGILSATPVSLCERSEGRDLGSGGAVVVVVVAGLGELRGGPGGRQRGFRFRGAESRVGTRTIARTRGREERHSVFAGLCFTFYTP